MATVHIIGGGISGLAAATQLAAAHVPVKLYEASAHAGGRARSSHNAALGSIDHGLHLIGSDAHQLFAYLKRIKADATLTRVNFPLPLPAAPLADYMEALPLLTRGDGALGSLLHATNILGAVWVQRYARLMLHTPAEQLSRRAMRRALWHMARRPQHWMVKHSLSDSFITPALTHLDFHGGSVYFNHALKGLDWQGTRVSGLSFARKKVPLAADDVVILATPPAFTQSLLTRLTVPTSTHSAITIHYALAPRAAGRIEAPAEGPVDLIRYQPDRISLTLRVADGQWHSDPEILTHRLWRWLQQRHPYLKTQPMPATAVWREKRAGHRLLPHAVMDLGTLPERVLIAGDWVDPLAPASLETAIASGHRAATAAKALMPSYPLRCQ